MFKCLSVGPSIVMFGSFPVSYRLSGRWHVMMVAFTPFIFIRIVVSHPSAAKEPTFVKGDEGAVNFDGSLQGSESGPEKSVDVFGPIDGIRINISQFLDYDISKSFGRNSKSIFSIISSINPTYKNSKEYCPDDPKDSFHFLLPWWVWLKIFPFKHIAAIEPPRNDAA